ncbi:MAG: HAD family hydrolase [Myxococcota bacterium]|jgi:HAD superfamily hydrolase (TIGR01509 family)|nr:HAD family hydrolase [Myxococcota bacterium]
MMALSPPRGIQAVLFDMDGTLLVSEDRTDRAIAALLAARGEGEPGADHPDVDPTRFHGVTWEATVEWLAERWPDLGGVDVAAELQRRFHETFVEDPPPQVPGAREALAAAAAVVPVAIVTSSNRETLTLVCDQLDLHGLVSATVAAEDCTASKPSPQPFVRAAERLGKDPRRCLVFEDSVAGVQAGLAAGAAVIAIGAESGHAPWLTDYHDLPEGFFAQAARPVDD